MLKFVLAATAPVSYANKHVSMSRANDVTFCLAIRNASSIYKSTVDSSKTQALSGDDHQLFRLGHC